MPPYAPCRKSAAAAAWRLDLLCHRIDNRIESVRIGLARPARDPRRLTRLLCNKIETIDPGLEIMALAATLAEPLAAKQAASSLIEAPKPDLFGVIATLTNRVGAKAVYRFAPVPSDVPERSACRIPAMAEELFATAAAMGIDALAVVDGNSLAGIVRAHEAAKATGVRLIVGCRLDLACGVSVLAYPIDRAAYARLCRLLTLGKGRAGKGRCRREWTDLVAYGEGLIAVLVPDDPDDDCAFRLRRLREAFGDRAYLALTLRRRPNDQMRIWQLSQLAHRLGVPTVVTNDVLFHERGRRMLQDVVTAIRHNTTIDHLGFHRERRSDRYLKPPAKMHRRPEALARPLEIMARCNFYLGQLAYQYPEERADPALTP